jgi:hypothetical protein
VYFRMVELSSSLMVMGALECILIVRGAFECLLVMRTVAYF